MVFDSPKRMRGKYTSGIQSARKQFLARDSIDYIRARIISDKQGWKFNAVFVMRRGLILQTMQTSSLHVFTVWTYVHI